MRKMIWLAIAFGWLLLLQACGQATDAAYALILKGLYKNTVPLIKPGELHDLLPEDIILLDTRSPEEYKVSHICHARLVDYVKFSPEQLKDVPRNVPVVVYCSVGYRSERVGEQLLQAGYTNVQNLYGGLFEWVNQGYPVFDQTTETNKVHAYSGSWGVWLQKGEKVYGSE